MMGVVLLSRSLIEVGMAVGRHYRKQMNLLDMYKVYAFIIVIELCVREGRRRTKEGEQNQNFGDCLLSVLWASKLLENLNSRKQRLLPLSILSHFAGCHRAFPIP